jgi:sec-independent protein translocase protein TatA
VINLAFGEPSIWVILLILVLALLFFGKRMPEVGRSLGKGIVEFKKGLRDVGEESNANANSSAGTGSVTTPQEPKQMTTPPPAPPPSAAPPSHTHN